MRGWLALVLRLLLGALFAFAGGTKIHDTSAFAVEIHNYQLLPSLAPLLAATFPFIEIATGLAILLGPREWRRAGGLVAAVLLGAFTVAVTSVVLRGININCGCFGAGSGPVTVATVARDLVLLAAAVALFLLSAPDRASATPAEKAPPDRPAGATPPSAQA